MKPEEIDINDIDAVIDQLGPCARVYWNMEQCIESNNRQWSKCQTDVKRLKECWTVHADAKQGERQMITELQKLKKKL